MHEVEADPTSLRILVVDDNDDAADTLSILLEMTGHRTGTAYNGLDAVAEATRERYDAVLLDLQMPIMDGFEAAGLLRQLQPAPKLIAYSSLDDSAVRKRTSELGFCAHLCKPAPLTELQHMLGRHCAGASMRSPEASR
jgi:CheY-like chemotaxis protein